MSLDKAKKLLKAKGHFGAGPILKAIGKIAPGIGSFVSGAFTAGYAADQIADFLENKFSTPEERRQRGLLEARASQGTARPDERAFLSQIEQNRAPLRGIGQLGRLGAQAAGGLGAVGIEREQQEQELAREQAAADQLAEERAYERERQAQLEAERARVQKQEELRKGRAEQRAVESHEMKMQRAKESKQAKNSSSFPSIDTTGLASAGKGMASAITDNFYQGVLDSLVKGKDTFSGVKEPLIAFAKPYFDSGMIKNLEDMKKIGQLYSQQKQKKSALSSLPKGTSGNWKEILDQIDNAINRLP